MIILTESDGREYAEGRHFAHLACGQCGFFYPNTRRLAGGRQLYEALKRYVSSGDFEAVLVTGFTSVLSGPDRDEAIGWIADHLAGNPFITLILGGVRPEEVPELA